jgi:hypothetical protein
MTLAKMCVYVAGPMTGYPDMNRDRFAEVTVLLRAQEWHVGLGADQASVVYSPGELHAASEREALRKELSWIIDTATHIALLEGHEVSRGGAIEKALARKFSLPVAPYWNFFTSGREQFDHANDWYSWYKQHPEISQERFPEADEGVAYWLGG